MSELNHSAPGAAGTLIATLAAGAAVGLSLTLLGSLEPWLVRDLGLGHGLAGLVQSAFFAGNLAGSLLAAALGHRLGSRARLPGALALLVAGDLICGVAWYPALLAGRLLCGAGVAATVVFGSAALVRRFPGRQGGLLNAFHAVIAGGAALALWAAPALAARAGGWTAAPRLAGVAGLAALLIAALAGRGDAAGPVTGGGSSGPGYRFLGRPALLATFSVMLGYMVAEQGVTTFFAAYLQLEGGSSAGRAARLAALFWLGLGGGRLLLAPLASRLPERGLLLGAQLAGLGLLAGLLWQGNPGEAAVTLFGGLMGPVIPLCFSRAARLTRAVPGGQERTLAAANALACAGGALGPLGVGLLADLWSLRGGLIGAWALALVLAIPLLASRGERRAGSAGK